MRGIKNSTAVFLFGLLGLLATSGALLGSAYVVQQSVLYPYQSSIQLQEEFVSGGTGTATIGNLGWNSTSGTTTFINSTANRIGLIQRDTTAVISTIARMFLSGTNTTIDPAGPHSIVWAFRLNTNDANTTVRIGEGNSFSSSPPTDGIYLEKLDADTNWFCVTRAGGAQTRTDSAVAVSTNFITLQATRNSSGAQFTLNNSNVCSLISTNIPTTFLNPGNQIINSAAAVKSMDLDYFQIQISGIVR